MTAPAHVIDPRSPDWYAERRTYIGASDVPIIIGISPHKTPFQLWLEKTGQAEPEPPSEVQAWGHRVEQLAADIYSETTGRRLRRYTKVQRHPRWPFIAANPDRGVIGERRGVQVKSSWKPWAEVPEIYLVQVQVEMGVMGWTHDDVALLTGFGGFRSYEIARDDLRIARLFTIVRAWWQRHMVEGIAPERTGRYLNPLRGEDTMRASELQVAWLQERRAVDEALARLSARKADVDDRIKRSMVGAKRLDGSDYGVNVTWTKPWSKEVPKTDWQAVARAYRLLLERTFWNGGEGDVALSEADGLVELGFAADADVLGALDAIESIHTNPITRTGGGGLSVRWKDAPEGEEEA